jgi:hypothetical protein
MKTLVEVEPRTIVNATNTPGDANSSYIITQPGSYYLESNIVGEVGKNGISIEAHGVTLDLNGFTLDGVPGSGSGIAFLALFKEDVIIRNGIVRGWGQNGIDASIDYGLIENIVATRNAGWGIDDANDSYTTRIIGCVVQLNGGGIASTGGINGGELAVIRDCVVHNNVGNGIQVKIGSTVQGNVVTATQTGAGIVTTGNANIIDGNKVSGCSNGILLTIGTSEENILTRNIVTNTQAGGFNYSYSLVNDIGPIGSAATSTSPWANILD